MFIWGSTPRDSSRPGSISQLVSTEEPSPDRIRQPEYSPDHLRSLDQLSTAALRNTIPSSDTEEDLPSKKSRKLVLPSSSHRPLESLLIIEDKMFQKKVSNSMFKDSQLIRATWSSSPRRKASPRRDKFQIPLPKDSSLLLLRNKILISMFLASLRLSLERSLKRSQKNWRQLKLSENFVKAESTRDTRENVRRRLESKLNRSNSKRRNEYYILDSQAFLDISTNKIK